MKKGWKQTWKNLLFQHFEIEEMTALAKYLPKNCTFDSFEGKYYLGLVSMSMTNVKHKATGNIRWFEHYDELNVRTYILHGNRPGILFLSLDVDSLISILGARILYGLPYRVSNYESRANEVTSWRKGKIQFQTEYQVTSEPKVYDEKSFAFWSTQRYFFANNYLGISFKGEISHKPWELSTASVKNKNLSVLDQYAILRQHPDIFFCQEIQVETNPLSRI
ncbi:MAG: Unknown protein [uncultured Sulfurovum sp.]|uniref:DUF2071 domain-containing protein n=1 Tax=uncultured Sulfurovum sp. TaxID=269237 RepID=A0A6S6S7V9_9BACT|nr:MAG: Unknown protein [uncultured Sulfurovum sp.]